MNELLSAIPKIVGINLLQRDQFLVEEDAYPFWNAFLVTRGSFVYGNEVIHEGELALFAPGEPYRRRVLSPMTFFSIHLEWKLPTSVRESALPRGKVTFRDPQRVLSTATLMKKAIGEPSALSLCDHFLGDIWLQYCLEAKEETPSLPPLLLRATEQIRQTLPHTLSIAELARELHVSHVYLIQLFKKHLNVTPTDYILGLRLERAKLLLTDTDEPIGALAERCGFSNAYYFSAIFKKRTGTSPSIYRKRYRT